MIFLQKRTRVVAVVLPFQAGVPKMGVDRRWGSHSICVAQPRADIHLAKLRRTRCTRPHLTTRLDVTLHPTSASSGEGCQKAHVRESCRHRVYGTRMYLEQVPILWLIQEYVGLSSSYVHICTIRHSFNQNPMTVLPALQLHLPSPWLSRARCEIRGFFLNPMSTTKRFPFHTSLGSPPISSRTSYS